MKHSYRYLSPWDLPTWLCLAVSLSFFAERCYVFYVLPIARAVGYQYLIIELTVGREGGIGEVGIEGDGLDGEGFVRIILCLSL